MLQIIPQELALSIIALLETSDILNLRQTCKSLQSITRERSLWIGLLLTLQGSVPLPLGVRSAGQCVLLTGNEIERVVITAQTISRRWLRPRLEQPLRPKPSRLGESIILFELVLEQYLLCIYAEGFICLWDIGAPFDCATRVSWTGLLKPEEELSWSSAAVTENGENVHVAVTKTGGPSITRAFCVHPSTSKQGSVHYDVVATVSHLLPLFVRAVDDATCSIAFSRSCYIDIYRWDTDVTHTISTQSEELDDLWNGIIGLRFHEDCIICLKTRSIEVYGLSRDNHRTSADCNYSTSIDRDNLQASLGNVYSFPGTTFRGMSLSSFYGATQNTSTTFHVLAYDILKGLFQYRVTVVRTYDALAPALSVELIGAHSMAYGTQEEGSRTSAVGARGFVTACCLGPQGKRGMWVERTRGSVKRSVVAFSTQEITDGSAASSKMNGRVIYESTSYDLRDDLTHCALCESSGAIMLGTRVGGVQILRL